MDVHMYGPGWEWGGSTRWRALAKRAKLWLLAASSRGHAAELADLDYRRGVASRYPDHVHAPVSDDELVALYSSSQVSLGFLEVYDRHDPLGVVKRHLHLREFEAPMSGALYCTGYMEELAEMFEPDKEVIVYRDQWELLDKIRFFLLHPVEAAAVRANGRKRALRDHTYHRRFEQLFTALGLRIERTDVRRA
jgi:hypothetical protein